MTPDIINRFLVDEWRPMPFKAAGGPGSGNFGHAGRPGQVGGSASTSGGSDLIISHHTTTFGSGGAQWTGNFQISELDSNGQRFMIGATKPIRSGKVLIGDRQALDLQEALYGPTVKGDDRAYSHAEEFGLGKQQFNMRGKYDDYIKGWVYGVDPDTGRGPRIQFYEKYYKDPADAYDAYSHAAEVMVTSGHATADTEVELPNYLLPEGQWRERWTMGQAFPYLFESNPQKRAAMRAAGGPGSGNFGHQGGEGGRGNPGGSTSKGVVVQQQLAKARDEFEQPEWYTPGDNQARVVWDIKSGDTIPLSKPSELDLGNDYDDLGAIHVGDTDYWKAQVSKDYDRNPDEAREILIRTTDEDVLADDVQYAMDPDGGDKATSNILLTPRKELVYGVDWVFEGEDFKAAGGPGSGNFGHAGRPGKVGGSAGRSDIGGPGESPATVSLAPPPGILEAIAKPDGGFTYSPTSGRQPKTGYALSIHKDRELVIDAKDATVGSLTAYARKNIDLLRQTDNYMGGWHNPEDGKVYIDVSTVVNSAEEAERLGRENKQIAYFDLAKGESVTIQYESRGLAARPAKEFNKLKSGRSPTSEGNDDEKGRSPSRRVEDRDADARRIDRDVEAPDRPRSDARRNRRGQENPRATLAATLLRRLDALRTLGGPGSGNFGHAGRPGQVGGSATTSTLTSEEKIDLVKRRVTEVAEQLGVDPSTIHVVDKDPRDFEVGGQWFKEAGHYNPITEEIEINARNSYSPVMGVTYGIAAHEATHSLYHEARKRQDTEHKEIANLPPDGYNKYFRQSGYVRPEMQEEVHKRWPVSAMWYRHTGDSYMETEPDQGQGGQGSRFVEMVGRLEKEDGITEYSKAYWSPTALNKMYGTEMAINETLAEVARLRITGETSKVPAIWEQFYFDLRHTVITTRPRQ